MLNIFILEDEFIQQSRIEAIIIDFINKNALKCKRPEVFGKPNQLIAAITEKGSHQLFFLDIQIKGDEKKGLAIAKEIRQKDPDATIVFVTTHSEFMPITFKYKVSALDFIDKSLNEAEFSSRVGSAIDYAIKKNGSSIAQNSFKFETAMAHIQVPFDKILYFETSLTVHKIILHTVDERMEFYGTISEIEKIDSRLYRCHRSFIVNPENILKIDKTEKVAMFANNYSCLISRTKYKGLLEEMRSLENRHLEK